MPCYLLQHGLQEIGALHPDLQTVQEQEEELQQSTARHLLQVGKPFCVVVMRPKLACKQQNDSQSPEEMRLGHVAFFLHRKFREPSRFLPTVLCSNLQILEKDSIRVAQQTKRVTIVKHATYTPV